MGTVWQSLSQQQKTKKSYYSATTQSATENEKVAVWQSLDQQQKTTKVTVWQPLTQQQKAKKS